MKGILLAGGKGTRLLPTSRAINKHLLLIYDKPLIYYSLSTLMLAGCRNINIITSEDQQGNFKKLLKDGSQWGLHIAYTIQESSNGIAEGIKLSKKFIGSDDFFLALGDNIFFGPGLSKKLEGLPVSGSCILGYNVADPERFGVIEIDSFGKVISIEEKPKSPKSSVAAVGLYFYKNKVINLLKELLPSDRGELEITDFNNLILSRSGLSVTVLGRGYYWADTGTTEALFAAAQFVKTMQESQSYVIGSPDEISYREGWITRKQLEKNLREDKDSSYSLSLKNYLRE